MKQRIRITQATRPKVLQAVQECPEGYFVSIQEAKRSLEQNSRMWAMLTDISKQHQWVVNGAWGYQSPEDWKDIFSSGLDQEERVAKGLRGGLVILGRRTSDMTIKEMTDLIELMFAWGAENGVIWSEKTIIPEWVQ